MYAGGAVTGIILAGGRSRRMGKDKAMALVGRRSLLDIAADVVAPFTDETLIVGPRRDLLDRGYRWIPDRYPGQGPLGGILSGLANASHDVALVVACDMPLVDHALLERLLTSYHSDVQAAVPRVGGKIQPLPAVCGISALPVIQESFKAGERSLTHAFAALTTRFVDLSGDEFDKVSSINTPDELERVQAIARSCRC